MRSSPDVVVVGAGLAGLSAAVHLGGHGVVVVEAADSPGGQCAGGYNGRGPWDFGVHGIYPRYAELRALLSRAGAASIPLVPARGQVVINPAGRATPIRMPRLPAPLHCAVHAATTKRPLRVLAAAARLDAVPETQPSLDAISILDLARRAGMPPSEFRRMYEPLALFGFFLDPAEVSAAAYLSALRFLITGRSDSWRAAWVPSPTSEHLIDPLVRCIVRRGGQVRMSTRAVGLRVQRGRVTAVELEGGRSLPAMAVVCAVPPRAAARLLTTTGADEPTAGRLRRLGETEVRTIRFTFPAGPAPPYPHGVALAGHQGVTFFHLRDRPGRVIEAQCPPGVTDVEARVSSLLPDRPRPLAVDALPVLPYARYAVGGTALRPGVAGPWPNLFFAGDWVDDPHGRWFMERAAATGRAAAYAVGGRGNPPPPRPIRGPGARCASALARRLSSGIVP